VMNHEGGRWVGGHDQNFGSQRAPEGHRRHTQPVTDAVVCLLADHEVFPNLEPRRISSS